MKFIIITLTSLFAVGSALAQDTRLMGRVTDEIGTPIAEARVTMQGADAHGDSYTAVASTDTAGVFSFSGMVRGNYQVVVRKNGYIDWRTTVSLAGRTDDLTIVLKGAVRLLD
ncbi:MAG TPA: carboxypeptidase-like regulatory domain-containing protein, partial [Parapedobacter sp.]|nr:carboxypeptidase-like regulatory domain-containing protein [Parapedobacter sp.]